VRYGVIFSTVQTEMFSTDA